MPLWLAPSGPVTPARSSAMVTGSLCRATSISIWSKARLRNVEYSATTGCSPPMARPAALVMACCSAMPTSNTRSGKAARERPETGRVQHRRGQRDDIGAPGTDRRELVAEHLRPGPLGCASRAARAERRGHLVQAVLLVLLGQRVAEALLRDHVHEHRAAEPACPAQRVLHHLLVVAVDRADVLQAEVLEQDLRLQHVLDALLDAVQRVVDRRADQRGARHRGLDVVEHVLVTLRDPDRGQVVGQAADRGLVGAAVVVDHDDDPAVLGDRDVVQRLPGHPAGQRAVADHGDHGAAGLAAQLVGLGQAVGVAEAGGGVRVLHDVVLGLGLAGIPRHAAALAQRVELVLPAGQQLVHVGLMTGVEHDPVHRRVEHAVQSDGELHHAEVGSEVAAGPRHDIDQDVADLGGQHRQLLGAEFLQVLRTTDRLQQGQLSAPLFAAHARFPEVYFGWGTRHANLPH